MSHEPIYLGELPPIPDNLLKKEQIKQTSHNKPKNGKKAKNTSFGNNVTIDESIPVELIFLGEYYNIHTMQKHPITKKFIEREAVELKAWADSDTALLLYDFTDKRGYDPDTFYRWCHEYPEMNYAHKYALRRIGSRREVGAMTRKFAEATIHRTLGYYNDIWKKETLELAKMKEEVAQAERTIVVMEKIPEQLASLRSPEQVAGDIKKTTERDYGPNSTWRSVDKNDPGIE